MHLGLFSNWAFLEETITCHLAMASDLFQVGHMTVLENQETNRKKPSKISSKETMWGGFEISNDV